MERERELARELQGLPKYTESGSCSANLLHVQYLHIVHNVGMAHLDVI